MTPMVKKLLMDKKPIIPQNLKPYCLAWWDARERGQVWYGLNQVCANGNFVNTNIWSNIGSGFAWSVANNEAIITNLGSSASAYKLYQSSTVSVISGHKYYFRAYMLSNNAGDGIGSASNSGTATKYHSGSGNYEMLSFVTTATGTGDGSFRALNTARTDDISANPIKIKNVLLLDLTLAMGAGNEPTAAEMDAILAADGNQYWEGTRQVLCNPDFKYYWKDYSGNGRHMKLNNFAYSGASGWQSPYGLQCDGVDDWCSLYNSLIIPANTDFSVVIFYNSLTDNAITVPIVCNKTSFADSNGSFYYNYIGGKFVAKIYDSVNTTETVEVTVTASEIANKCYCIILTYSQSDKKLRMFKNGVLVSTSAALTNGNKEINYVFMAKAMTEAAYYVQKNNAMGLLNKALNLSEAQQIYQNNKRRFSA